MFWPRECNENSQGSSVRNYSSSGTQSMSNVLRNGDYYGANERSVKPIHIHCRICAVRLKVRFVFDPDRSRRLETVNRRGFNSRNGTSAVANRDLLSRAKKGGGWSPTTMNRVGGSLGSV